MHETSHFVPNEKAVKRAKIKKKTIRVTPSAAKCRHRAWHQAPWRTYALESKSLPQILVQIWEIDVRMLDAKHHICIWMSAFGCTSRQRGVPRGIWGEMFHLVVFFSCEVWRSVVQSGLRRRNHCIKYRTEVVSERAACEAKSVMPCGGFKSRQTFAVIRNGMISTNPALELQSLHHSQEWLMLLISASIGVKQPSF